MKKFFLKYGYPLLLMALFSGGAFLRLYNFEIRLIFGPEQAISLLTSAANLDKFSLLGEYNLQRFTSAGHNLIHGPLFSYFLLPLILAFNYRVLPISLVFVGLNLLTALILFFIIRKIFGNFLAVLTLFYFLFSSLMVYHSLFIWIYHPLILLGALSIWLVAALKQKPHRPRPVFWLGFVGGVGFSLQYPFLVFAAFLIGLVLLISPRRFFAVLVFGLGFFLANTSRIIFDLRHDFYHLRTLRQFFQDVYVNKTISAATYSYHYLHLFPYFCLLLALLTLGLYNLKKPLAILPILVFLYLNLSSPLLSLNRSLGMSAGLTLKSLESAAAAIAFDRPPERFNVAALWDFDTLARPMRYLLRYYHGLTPRGYADYANVDSLYVLAPESYNIDNPKVWELRAFLPYKVRELESPAGGYRFYKLTK